MVVAASRLAQERSAQLTAGLARGQLKPLETGWTASAMAAVEDSQVKAEEEWMLHQSLSY